MEWNGYVRRDEVGGSIQKRKDWTCIQMESNWRISRKEGRKECCEWVKMGCSKRDTKELLYMWAQLRG